MNISIYSIDIPNIPLDLLFRNHYVKYGFFDLEVEDKGTVLIPQTMFRDSFLSHSRIFRSIFSMTEAEG